MRRSLSLSAALLLVAGCSTVPPFPPVPTVPPGDASAEAWRAAVAASTPVRFVVTGSVVFDYRRRGMAAISVTRIDEPERFLSVVAVSPLGMKLFEIEKRGARIERSLLAPGLDARGDPVPVIAKDIEHVYHDRIPSSRADVRRVPRGFEFAEAVEGGRLEHLLGGSPPVLLEKRFYDGRGLVWEATYHLYDDHDGLRYPRGIVYRHRRHGYRIVLRVTEVIEGTSGNGNPP